MTEADELLVECVRRVLKRRKGVTEKKMFGGVCFMINGNMCVGPWKGSLIVRLPKEKHDETQAEPFVHPMDITGKVMKGWARVEPAGIADDEDLKSWVRRGTRFAASLPPK